MRKVLLCAMVVVSTLAFTSCNSYGKKVKINDQLEVYAKKDATEAEAKKLGDYLSTLDNQNKNEKSFQLEKEKDAYTVRMVVPEEVVNQKEMESSFQALQYLIKENVFPGKTVKLILTDNTFNDKKTIAEMAMPPAEETAPETDSTAVQ